MNHSAPNSISIPPLAGICSYAEAGRTGLTVDRTVGRLRRYVYIKTRLVFMLARRFNGVAEWEAKGALALHLWQDAEHGTSFRARITEMRTPPHHLDRAPDPMVESLMSEVEAAPSTALLFAGIYGVIRPALAAAYREHSAQAHPIADYPTRRLLRTVLGEEEDEAAWGTAALRTWEAGDEGPEMVAWQAHIRGWLDAAGGVHGEADERPAPPSATAAQSAVTSLVPKRDGRFSRVWNSRGVVPEADRPVHERIWWMMVVRLNEMHVAELIATVLADWKGQPWAFYRDLARHLWDETRHCLLGEAAFAAQGIDFTKVPSHIGFAEYPNTRLTPSDRYAFLWGIEQGLMGKTGKQAEVALAKAGGDERATVFQDFDWADEVLHAQIGRRWLEPHYGSREKMHAVYERVRPDYDRMKEADLRLPGRDWWPGFYTRHLKDRTGKPVE